MQFTILNHDTGETKTLALKEFVKLFNEERMSDAIFSIVQVGAGKLETGSKVRVEILGKELITEVLEVSKHGVRVAWSPELHPWLGDKCDNYSSYAEEKSIWKHKTEVEVIHEK